MAITVTDASSGLYYWLKNDSEAAGIRALIYDSNVLEDGDLTNEILDDAFKARAAASQTTKVLAITVHDAGEKGTMAQVIVRIYDRRRGYRNIRAVRDLFLEVWRDSEEKTPFTLTTVNGKKRGVLTLDYVARTGHLKVKDYTSDFEGIALSGNLLLDDW